LHDRYQPGALLGSGGYSVVYHARDMWEDGRGVAIKQINLQGLNAEQTIEATNTFNREVQLLSSLNHPQVPRLYDHFGDSDHWYLVLEYLEGSTLEVYLEMRAVRSQPIQVDEALSIALQVCTVLEYLHTRQPPVIFRDLKPGNIIRTPAGKLSLIDFGIARHYRPGQVRDTQRLGSPGYAAPEQYGRSQTTPQADIYSLGALLHALLSGQDPATQQRGLAPLHLNSRPGEGELAELVQRMLAPDPLERPASVNEVAAVLTRLEQTLGGLADPGRIWIPPTPQEVVPEEDGARQIQIMLPAPAPQIILPPQGYRTGRRNVLIGLGALAAAWVGGHALWHTMAPPRPFPLPEPEGFFGANLLYTYQGHTDAVWNAVWSPDGARIASCSLDDTVRVWGAFDGGDPFVYRGHAKGLMDVAWSPDGSRVASASADSTVRLWNALDGSNSLVYRGHMDTVQEANWSPDGQFIASCSQDKTVQIWNAMTGNLVGTYQGHQDGVLAAKWSPDGSRIASSSLDHTVHIWEAATLRPVVVYQGHSAPVAEVAWSPDGSLVVSGSDDKTAQVWSAADGSNLVKYTGHEDKVISVSWSPYGSWIVSSSDDSTAQVWRAFDGDQVFTYSGHKGPVIEVNWSPDGSMIASASVDSSVQIWSFQKHRKRRTHR